MNLICFNGFFSAPLLLKLQCIIEPSQIYADAILAAS